MRKQVYSLAEARKLLFDYFYAKTVVYGRTPMKEEAFDVDWDQLIHVLVSKAIKDTMIQFSRANQGAKEITLTQIKSTFFDVS